MKNVEIIKKQREKRFNHIFSTAENLYKNVRVKNSFKPDNTAILF